LTSQSHPNDIKERKLRKRKGKQKTTLVHKSDNV